ncbi:MAG: energy transducer TonB [Spirochaetales bacterium]|nr:energy transducer TonB [Spirochaetales bacterium]
MNRILAVALGVSIVLHAMLFIFVHPGAAPAEQENATKISVRLTGTGAALLPDPDNHIPEKRIQNKTDPADSDKADTRITRDSNAAGNLDSNGLNEPRDRFAGSDSPEAGQAPDAGNPLPSISDGPAAGADAAALAEYNRILSIVRAGIQDGMVYPLLARRKGMEGEVGLSFVLDEAGRIGQVKVLASSGYAVLDRAALKLMKSISPLDAFPEQKMSLSVTIVYDLQKR